MIPEEILPMDLGHGVRAGFVQWSPDRELNPQYDGIPDVEKFGLIYTHAGRLGPCEGSITFAGDVASTLVPKRPTWEVQCWEPLTLWPSLLCRRCGHHGFVREGKWVPA